MVTSNVTIIQINVICCFVCNNDSGRMCRIEKEYKKFNTKTKIMICSVFEGRELTIKEIVTKLQIKYDTRSNRETIYRSLEQLTSDNIVKKIQIKNKRGIAYILQVHQIVINFENNSIQFLYN